MPNLLPCDGCGQPADSAHISRRLERLAWTTRFRPLHIQTLLLSGIAPKENAEFLYFPESLRTDRDAGAASFQGEAAAILQALQLSTEGKSPEAVQTEFQKLGRLLTYVLECPLEDGVTESEAHALLEKQLPLTITRIRRSLKPKRLLLLSTWLEPFAERFRQSELNCTILATGKGSAGIFAGP
jgi:hypothetical protein